MHLDLSMTSPFLALEWLYRLDRLSRGLSWSRHNAR
jgi:hypothetical protein